MLVLKQGSSKIHRWVWRVDFKYKINKIIWSSFDGLNYDSIKTKVVNSVLISVLFFQLKWNVSVSKCFGVLFWGCTVHIYIYIYKTNIIQIQDKLIINYAIQTQWQTNIILKFKYS
jgi:hypothetical protein